MNDLLLYIAIGFGAMLLIGEIACLIAMILFFFGVRGQRIWHSTPPMPKIQRKTGFPETLIKTPCPSKRDEEEG